MLLITKSIWHFTRHLAQNEAIPQAAALSGTRPLVPIGPLRESVYEDAHLDSTTDGVFAAKQIFCTTS